MVKRLIFVALAPLLTLAAMFALLRYLWSAFTDPAKAWAIAVAFDDLANVGANGRLGQTISSRAAYAEKSGKAWGCLMCKLLDAVNPGHCAKALSAVNQNLNRGRV